MLAQLGKLLLFACLMAAGTPAIAQAPDAKCQFDGPKPFPKGTPFVLHDPRSGVTLRVEKDGRHMSATTRAGKLVWQRDIFSDPDLWRRVFTPPPRIQGEKQPSEREWQRMAQSEMRNLFIDRIGLQPDCMVRIIDRSYPRQLRGHHIFAGSGTVIMWLLDARTGDMQMSGMN